MTMAVQVEEPPAPGEAGEQTTPDVVVALLNVTVVEAELGPLLMSPEYVAVIVAVPAVLWV